eukprot:TRINITY_DN588_c0_g1_i3.p2 TRINITY_DN588_c0_g1~~TRINITY_DN588_c0_g1_i3.p2  ORF type:complete len:253 (+),score=68.18 TRINITY_DN588_c0_g1_i3:1322-2080(+)
MLRRWLPKVGLGWTGFTQKLKEGKERFAHEMRERLRVGRSKSIEQVRRSMRDLGEGADPSTNELWQRLRKSNDPIAARALQRVITGGVFYINPRGWHTDAKKNIEPPKEGEDTTSGEEEEEEEEEMTRPTRRQPAQYVNCDICEHEVHEHDMLKHALWDCELAREIQNKEANRAVVEERTAMPRCMQLHGVLPRGHDKEHLKNLQLYLLEVVTERDRRLQEKRALERYTTHPWEVIEEKDTRHRHGENYDNM